jgi:hypothetical protein
VKFSETVNTLSQIHVGVLSHENTVDNLGMLFLDLNNYLYKFYLPPMVPALGTTESRHQAAECLQKLNNAVVVVMMMVVGVE